VGATIKKGETEGQVMGKTGFQGITLEAPADPASSASMLDMGDPSRVTAKAAFGEALLRGIVREQDFSAFVRESLLSLMNILKWEAGSVLEFDHETDNYFFRAVTGRSSDKLPQFRVPRGQGIVGKVGEERRVCVMRDAESEKAHLGAIAKAVGFEVKCLVALPLVIGGRLYGVLELLNPEPPETLDEGAVSHLERLAELMALAIEARLKVAWGKA
jgi:transcriptional regulator with GAF, ATPase, and Fis domain